MVRRHRKLISRPGAADEPMRLSRNMNSDAAGKAQSACAKMRIGEMAENIDT